MKNRNNTDKHKDNGILLLKSDLVKYYQEVVNVGGEQAKKLFRHWKFEHYVVRISNAEFRL